MKKRCYCVVETTGPIRKSPPSLAFYTVPSGAPSGPNLDIYSMSRFEDYSK